MVVPADISLDHIAVAEYAKIKDVYNSVLKS
jgi:hypothetical protein